MMCVRDKYISSNLVDSYLSGILRIIYIYIFLIILTITSVIYEMKSETKSN